jgi:hypothetical protein
MRPPVVAKFAFRIRTRKGIVFDVVLPGRDAADAERKLHQIYRECEVLARGMTPLPESAAGLAERQIEAAR